MFGIFGREASVLKNFPGRFPKLIYVDFGTDEEHLSYVRRKQHRDGLMQYRTDLYKPYNEFSETVIDWAITTEELIESFPHKKALINDWILNQGYTADTLKFISFSGRYMGAYMAIDSKSAKFIDVLPKYDLRKPKP